MNDIINRPDLAVAAALVVTLLWLGVAFWLRFRSVGDELSERLDALQPDYQMTDLKLEQPAPSPTPRLPILPRVVMPNIFEQLCQELGVTP